MFETFIETLGVMTFSFIFGIGLIESLKLIGSLFVFSCEKVVQFNNRIKEEDE